MKFATMYKLLHFMYMYFKFVKGCIDKYEEGYRCKSLVLMRYIFLQPSHCYTSYVIIISAYQEECELNTAGIKEYFIQLLETS